MAETIATANPAPANASALRCAWRKSRNDRCIYDVPSVIRRSTVGLAERMTGIMLALDLRGLGAVSRSARVVAPSQP